MEFRDFDFVTKGKLGGRYSCDPNADITLHASEANGGTVYFTFRKGIHKDIAPNTEHFAYAISGSRIYFKEMPSKEGYRFSRNAKNSQPDNGECRYVSFVGKVHRKLYEFCKGKDGDYEIVFDGRYQLWFIETGLNFQGKYGRTE